MSLYKKVLLYFGIIGLVAIVASAIAVENILMRSFERLEEQQVARHLEQVDKALRNEISRLETLAYDWGGWDDTYQFIVDQNEAYRQSNLMKETPIGLNVDAMIYLDRQGDVVHALQVDLATNEEIPLSQPLLALLRTMPMIWQHSHEESQVSGMVLLADGPLLFASQPILTSLDEGPIRGSLIFARYLDEQEIAHLADSTRLTLGFFPAADPVALPADLSAVWAQLSLDEPVRILPLDDETVAGYRLLADVQGAPILLLQVTEPRDVYQQGRATISYFLITLAFSVAVFLLLLLLFLRKTVLARLESLTAQVEGIGANSDSSARVTVGGNDEITRLSETINTMLLALDRSEQSLKASQAHLTATLNVIPDMLFRFDRKGTYQFCRAEDPSDLLFAPDEFADRSIFDVLPPQPAEVFFAHLQKALQTGEMQQMEYELNTERVQGHFEARIAPFDDESVFSIVRNITKQKEMEHHLIAAREEAEAASQAKSEFLANTSHEIRTPLNAVLGMATLLLNTPLNTEQRDFVETIHSSGNTLLGVLNDVLDFSKIESGHMLLDQQTFDLSETVASAMHLFAAGMEQKGIGLVQSVAADLPSCVVGDAMRLRQILVNLVGNAVKFTHEGQVAVTVRRHLVEPQVMIGGMSATDGEEQPLMLHVSVRDTGIGIPRDQADRIFHAFSQGDASTTRKYGGTGLGLAISKRLCELMGGTMWMESEVGIGSTFHFTIAVLPAPTLQSGQKQELTQKEQPASTLLDAEIAHQHPLRILLAEDNIVNQKVAVHLLARLGYSVDVVDNGTEAVAAVACRQYDLVLMDIQMPEMDGMEATRQIRAQLPADRQPCIIALTANAVNGIDEECRVAGMNGHISKPIRLAQLVAHLRQTTQTSAAALPPKVHSSEMV